MNIGDAICTQVINHNLDKPNQPHFAVSLSIKCKSKGGITLKQFNGVAEINRFGDGYGSFVCGKLTSNDLTLSNCTVN